MLPENVRDSALAPARSRNNVAAPQRGQRRTKVFVRDLRHPPQRVWAALTEPAQLAQWAPFVANRNLANLGGAPLSLAVGGTESFAARVQRAVAPTLLEYTCGEDLLVWELRRCAVGTRVTLNYTVAAKDWIPNVTGWHIHLAIAEQLMTSEPHCPGPTYTPHERPLLTRRQAAIVQGLLQGKSNKAISNDLGISLGTVKNHLWSVYRALGVGSRLQAIARVHELGLVGPSREGHQRSIATLCAPR